jgi:hypothetical protein
MRTRTPQLGELLHAALDEMLDTAPGLEKSVPLPTLPYAGSYQEWTDHLEWCARCAYTMCLGTGETPDLCIEGQAYQEAFRWDVAAQADASVWN